MVTPRRRHPLSASRGHRKAARPRIRPPSPACRCDPALWFTGRVRIAERRIGCEPVSFFISRDVRRRARRPGRRGAICADAAVGSRGGSDLDDPRRDGGCRLPHRDRRDGAPTCGRSAAGERQQHRPQSKLVRTEARLCAVRPDRLPRRCRRSGRSWSEDRSSRSWPAIPTCTASRSSGVAPSATLLRCSWPRKEISIGWRDRMRSSGRGLGTWSFSRE